MLCKFHQSVRSIRFLSLCFVQQSTGTASHVRWSPKISLPSIDSTQTWSWTSLCGRARIEIPACRQIIYITHPLQVSRVLTKSDNDDDIPTKYIHIFAPVRRCFSVQRLPVYISNFVEKCLQLIDADISNTSHLTDDDQWNFELPLPLPITSCPKAHRHRLHHQMMLEADLHILQTGTVTYRLEYDHPATVEALLMEEDQQILTDYILTCDIQSSFYSYYSIKDQVTHFYSLYNPKVDHECNDLSFFILIFSNAIY